MLKTKDALNSENSMPGIAILQASSGKNLYQPTKVSETVVRVYPEPASDGKSFLSYRSSGDNDDFTNWLVVDYVAKYVGSEQKITFITRTQNADPKLQESLWDRLVRIVIRSIDDQSHPEWVYLIRGRSGQSAPIPGTTARAAKAKLHGFVQGLLIKHKGVSFRNTPKPNTVLMLPPTARIALQQLCNEENPKWDRVDPNNYDMRFKHGDWVNPATGRELIVSFHQPDAAGGEPEQDINYENIGNVGVSTKTRGNANNGFMNNRYDVTLSTHQSKVPPPVVHKYWKPWEQVLRYLNEQEQVELMCTAFKPDVVRAAFGGLNLLPRSIEFGTTISAPPVSSRQPAAQPAPRRTRDEDPDPTFSNNYSFGDAAEGGDEEAIDYANLDDSIELPGADAPSQPAGAPVVQQPVADPSAVDAVTHHMSSLLQRARQLNSNVQR